jgi:8-oxo-dGTP pyrophosphatase MutT (NUDIX family)
MNCGQNGHDYKHCREPIISFGVILIQKTDKKTENKINNLELIKKHLKIKSSDDKISEIVNSIQVLMISRKHSLGFSEFIRGKYSIDNITGIIFLFQQMNSMEIEYIKNKSFDELWDFFWTDDSKKEMFEKDYLLSKEKFMNLKEKKYTELSLDFYVNNIKPMYTIPEWGFPKGRRQKSESDIECALREFHEETNFSTDDIQIVENVNPIEEDITGTNGIKYRHVYYLAESKINLVPKIEPTNISQISEIGNIKFLNYDQALNVIREYHIEKKNILTNIVAYYVHKTLITEN